MGYILLADDGNAMVTDVIGYSSEFYQPTKYNKAYIVFKSRFCCVASCYEYINFLTLYRRSYELHAQSVVPKCNDLQILC